MQQSRVMSGVASAPRVLSIWCTACEARETMSRTAWISRSVRGLAPRQPRPSCGSRWSRLQSPMLPTAMRLPRLPARSGLRSASSAASRTNTPRLSEASGTTPLGPRCGKNRFHCPHPSSISSAIAWCWCTAARHGYPQIFTAMSGAASEVGNPRPYVHSPVCGSLPGT